MQIEQFRKYECLVDIRPAYKGRPARPSALALNGKTLVVEALWLGGDDDPYPGEWAMGLPHELGAAGDSPVWLASGDVKILREVPRAARQEV